MQKGRPVGRHVLAGLGSIFRRPGEPHDQSFFLSTPTVASVPGEVDVAELRQGRYHLMELVLLVNTNRGERPRRGRCGRELRQGRYHLMELVLQ
jgi:hypothetical protein